MEQGVLDVDKTQSAMYSSNVYMNKNCKMQTSLQELSMTDQTLDRCFLTNQTIQQPLKIFLHNIVKLLGKLKKNNFVNFGLNKTNF